MDISKRKAKTKFTREEDEIIVKCVESMKKNNKTISWNEVASHLSSRTNKQIRERYLYFLDSNIIRTPLSSSDFELLAKLVIDNSYLPRIPWRKISTFFPGRSDIFLKNQYDQIKRKMLKNTFDSDLQKMKQIEFNHHIWNEMLNEETKA
jgi:hypothetical protein